MPKSICGKGDKISKFLAPCRRDFEKKGIFAEYMKHLGKKKVVFAVTIALALIIAVSGIGKFHANPFAFSLTTKSPAILARHSSDLLTVIADRLGTVMLIMDNNGKLQHTVKVNNADHPHDRVSLIHIEQDSIYANVVTMKYQHIVREQIRLYDKRGKYVRTVSDNAYEDDRIFDHRNQMFVRCADRLSVIRIEDNVLKTILIDGESAVVADSVCLSEPVIEVRQGKGSALCVSGLFGKMYEYFPGSGCTESVHLSDSDYNEIILSDVPIAISIPYSIPYAVANILFWLSLLYVVVAGLFFAFRAFHNRYNKTIGIIVAAVLLIMGVVAFYTYHIFRQTKSELTQMMVYQTDLLAYVTEHNYLNLVKSLSSENIDSCLVKPEIMEQLSDLHTILAKSSQYDGNEYYVGIIYNCDSVARQLVDNMNLLSTGQPAHISQIEWNAPSTDGADILTNIYGKIYCTAHNVTDKAGKIVAKIISIFPDHLLRSAQKEKALELILSLLSILIGIYTLFTFILAIRHSISEYVRRSRASLPYAKEHLFPTFYAFIVWFREVDRAIMVFIIPYFTAGGSIGDLASVTAIVLMAYSIGGIVMVPFTKVAYTRFGTRPVGIAASIVNLLSYVLMVVALKSSEVNLFYLAKFLSGAAAGNVLTVVANGLGASVKDQSVRAKLFNDKQTVGNTINVLAILLGGYLIQYLSPVFLYYIAIFMSALLIGITAITLNGLSGGNIRNEDKTPTWRDMVASFKFFILKDGISIVWFVLLPASLMFAFLDYIYPLHASECGISPLMLSNIMVIGLALNLLLRKPLNKYYLAVGTKRALIFQFTIISAVLLMLLVSPNIIWMTVICLAIYVFKMNSSVMLYQVEAIERNGFKQEDVQSDCLLVDQVIRTVRMPFINMLVQVGRVSASIWIGVICALLSGGFALFGKRKILPPQSSAQKNEVD